MLYTDTVNSLGGTLVLIGQSLLAIVPTIIIALLVLLIGIFVANILGRLVTELMEAIKLDSLFTKSGLRDAFKRGGISLGASNFVGGFVRWVVILAFLVTTLEVLGLSQVTAFLTGVLGYVPEVVSAALIIVVTAVIAEFLKKVVGGSTRAAMLGGAEFSATLVKVTVWVFGLVVALQELGLPTALFQIVITGVIAGLALAFGLAFGLGGRDVAAKILDKKYDELHK